MLSILRSNQPIAVILIPFTGALLFVAHYFFGVAELGTGYHGWLPSTLNMQPSLWLHFILVTVNALIVNHIFNQHELGSGRSNLTGWMFVFAAGALPVYAVALPFWLGLMAFLMGMHQTLKVYRQNDGTRHYFDAAFLFGLASICWTFFSIGGVLLITSILYTRAARWRELLLPVIAFSLPAAIFFTLLWLFEVSLYSFEVLPDRDMIPVSLEAMIPNAYWLLLITLGAGYLFASFGSSSNKSKNSKAIVFLFSLGTGILALVFGRDILGVNIAMLPFAFLAPWVFIRKAGKGQTWLFTLFLLSVVASLVLLFR